MGAVIWYMAAFVALAIGFSLIVTVVGSWREEARYRAVNHRIDTIRDNNYIMQIENDTVTIHWPDGTTERITKRESESQLLFGNRISDVIDGKLSGDF